MLNDPDFRRDSAGWRGFVLISFGLSALAMGVGIYHLPVDLWVRGYVAMGALFLVGSSFTLAKTLRDEHEAQQWMSRARDARADGKASGFDAA